MQQIYHTLERGKLVLPSRGQVAKSRNAGSDANIAARPSWRLRSRLRRRGYGGLVLATPHSTAGGLQPASGRYVLRRSGQAEHGHVVVYGLVLTRFHGVGLVPDADAPVRTHGLVEAPPRREVRVVGVAGE